MAKTKKDKKGLVPKYKCKGCGKEFGYLDGEIYEVTMRVVKADEREFVNDDGEFFTDEDELNEIFDVISDGCEENDFNYSKFHSIECLIEALNRRR